ncbi:MAG: MFS transporter, partial [Chloroflexi bacterium]|nr:MFS transporter [Chloroflexota bacterium]
MASNATGEAGNSPLPPSGRTGAGFLTVLRNRSFLAIWLAQVASQTAQNALWYALIIMVADVTGRKPAGVGFTIILVQLPTVLFSSISGVFVDRVSKRWVLIGTNAVRVFGALLYVVFQSNVAGLYLVTFLVAVVSQPFAPAEGSTLPLIVEGDELITANSLFQITFMAAQGVGFALSPVAIGVFGIRTTLIGIAALFALSALVLFLLPAHVSRHLPTRE